jgi:hypothetical protein
MEAIEEVAQLSPDKRKAYAIQHWQHMLPQ